VTTSRTLVGITIVSLILFFSAIPTLMQGKIFVVDEWLTLLASAGDHAM
jgi:hypothetical protein